MIRIYLVAVFCMYALSAHSQCPEFTGILFEEFVSESCSRCEDLPFTLVTTDGVASDLHLLEFSASDGTVGSAFWTDGTGVGSICIDVAGCDPLPITPTFDVYCI